MRLTINNLIDEAAAFSERFSTLNHVELIGVPMARQLVHTLSTLFKTILTKDMKCLLVVQHSELIFLQ